MTRAEVGIFFRDLGPLLKDVPVTRNSVWMDTGAFTEGGSAPTARHGDIGKLTSTLSDWARDKEFPRHSQVPGGNPALRREDADEQAA